MASSSSADSSSCRLTALFAYNHTLGGEQNEHEKLLVFHPPLPIETQKSFVGLTEAFCNFSATFPVSTACSAVHCQRNTHAFIHPEENVCIALVVANPSVQVAKRKSSVRGEQNANKQYLMDEISDSVLKAILEDFYSMFRLFNGTFHSIAEEHSWDLVRDKLSSFVQSYAPTIRFKQLQFFTDISGFQFLPVDRPTFLLVQYLINAIMTGFDAIKSITMLYDHRLIVCGTGIDRDDLNLLYSLDRGTLRELYTYFAMNDRENDDPTRHDIARKKALMAQTMQTGRSGKEKTASRYTGQFLTGPAKTGLSATGAPKLFLKGSDVQRLVVYKQHRVTLFIVVENDKEETHRDLKFYSSLSDFLGPNIDSLSRKLKVQLKKTHSDDDQFTYLYFNHLNLALKSSLHVKRNALTLESIKALRSIHEEFQNENYVVEELYMKTRADGWIVGKKGTETQREYYMLLEDSLHDLNDAEGEVKELENIYFSHISTL